MKPVIIRQKDSLDYSGKEALNGIATNLTFVGRQMNRQMARCLLKCIV